MDDTAYKNGHDENPDGEEFEEAAVSLALVVSDETVDDKKVVDNQEEGIKYFAGIKIVFVNRKDGRVKKVDEEKKQTDGYGCVQHTSRFFGHAAIQVVGEEPVPAEDGEHVGREKPGAGCIHGDFREEPWQAFHRVRDRVGNAAQQS